MKNIAARTLLASALALAALGAHAADEPWMMRVRAVNLDSSNGDTTGLGLSINNKVIPEVDFSYFFSPNIAAELILTYPQQHTLTSSKVGADIATLKHLPPTLSLQYHFAPQATFRPYVGLGVNYTNFSSVNFYQNVAALNPSIDSGSWGLSAQIGADVVIGKNLYLNFDVKKVQISTKVYANGNSVGKFSVDPVLVGVGLGFRF